MKKEVRRLFEDFPNLLDLLVTLEWTSKRKEIMERDDFRCVLCGADASNKHNFFNVHHIEPLSISWEKRLANNNLVTLCVSCHKNTFGKEQEMISLFQDIVRTHRRL